MKDTVICIDGKKYRKLKTIWNGNVDINKVDICHSDKWIMINGIEYEELIQKGETMHTKAFLKCKKEIEELTDYNRGYYAGFWVGYIHGLFDYDHITEEEGMELEDLFTVEG